LRDKKDVKEKDTITKSLKSCAKIDQDSILSQPLKSYWTIWLLPR